MIALTSSLGFALVALAAGEFVLLRVLLRMGPSLPEGHLVDAASRIGYQAGLWSLNTGAVLAVIVLLIIGAGYAARSGVRAAVAAAAFTTAGMLVALWASALAGVWFPGLLALQVIALPVVAGVAVAVARPAGGRMVWLGIALVAQLIAGASILGRSGSSVVPGLAAASEIVAVAAAIALPFALRLPLRIGPAVAASTLGLIYLLFSTFEPSIARFFLLWDFGLLGALPGPLHAISLAAIAYVAAAGLSSRVHRVAVSGALLIVLAGLRLENTYFAAIGAAGVYLLLVSDLPSPASARAGARGGVGRAAADPA
ncbi:MAG: hypothetical protein HY682_11475 [Chloroflexi bacterium]|nr:hypothetical protein [Chloroflexota bacterium]